MYASLRAYGCVASFMLLKTEHCAARTHACVRSIAAERRPYLRCLALGEEAPCAALTMRDPSTYICSAASRLCNLQTSGADLLVILFSGDYVVALLLCYSIPSRHVIAHFRADGSDKVRSTLETDG